MREKDYYGAIKGFCLKWNLPEVWNSDRITGANLIYEVIKVINSMIVELREYEDCVDEKLEVMQLMIDDFLRMFNEDLNDTVKDILIEWKDSGILEGIINDALFNQKADKVDFEKIKVKVNDKFTSVKEFGAKGDGVTDDTVAIQQALDSEEHLTIYFPKGEYMVYATGDNALEINVSGKNLVGDSRINTKIKVGNKCRTLLQLNEHYFTMKNLYIGGNDLSDFTLNSDEYTPFITIDDCWFDMAVKTACRLTTFLTNINNTNFTRSNIGLTLTSIPGNVTTANSVTSSYANNNVEYGFYFGGHDGVNKYSGVFAYSTLNNLACDNMPNSIAYGGVFRGVTMNSCGAERVAQYLELNNGVRALTINGGFMLNCGKSDRNLIELGGGTTTVINGFFIDKTVFNKKVVVTDISNGSENVIINDSTIVKSETSVVGDSWRHGSEVFYFVRNENNRDEIVNLNNTNITEELMRLKHRRNNKASRFKLTQNISVSTLVIPVTYGRMVEIDLNGFTIIVSDYAGINIQGGTVKLKGGTIINTTPTGYSRVLNCGSSAKIILEELVINVTSKSTSSLCLSDDGLYMLKNVTVNTSTDNAYKIEVN